MYDSYNSNDFDEFFGSLFIILLLLVLLMGIAGYIISSLIYYQASKTNGFDDLAYIAWIPIINVYSLFLLTAKGDDDATVRAEALKNVLIYGGLLLVSFIIPFIGIFASFGIWIYVMYFTYRLFYRWSGEPGRAVLYIILSLITFGLFYFIYGLMKMNKPFVA
ncbi:hypothetical protein LSPCS325_29080 [Lysinibacillus sp. CTST325]